MTQKTIVFDFGGVIFRTSVTEFYRERFAKQGRSEEELKFFLATVLPHAELSATHVGDTGPLLLEKAEQYPEWAEEILAIGADREFLRQVRNVLPGMAEVLEDLDKDGYRIVGLTNWAGDTYDTLPKGFPDILGHFNQVVVSGKVHLRKPDPAIFTLAQEVFGNPNPEDVYYFDDKQKNVEIARQTVGWNSFVFKDAGTVRQALALQPKPF